MAAPTSGQIARQLLEVFPPVMHHIRRGLSEAAGRKLTLPQFRILANVERGLDRVGEIAGHHGVSQPAMTKMVNSLCARGLLRRTLSGEDRRETVLTLTPAGRRLFREVKLAARRKLGRELAHLSGRERESVTRALRRLSSLFSRKVKP